jgi:aspartate aminotransferase-like enzyme
MLQSCGPVSTISSPALLALSTALEQDYAGAEAIATRFQHYASLGRYVRQQMMQAALTPLAPCDIAAPNITTFPLPSPAFPKTCLDAGFHIAFESPYLQQRSWGQIATMGDISIPILAPLFEALPGSLSK